MRTKKARIFNKKRGVPDQLTYAYMTMTDIYDFTQNFNQAEVRKRVMVRGKLEKRGRLMSDASFDKIASLGYPGLELKYTTKKRQLKEVKSKLYKAMVEEIFESIVKDDEVVDIYYGQCFLHAGTKTRNSDNYSNIRYYSNKIFFLVTHFFPHGVKYLVSLRPKTKYLKMLNEYKTKRTYEPKHFIHRPS